MEVLPEHIGRRVIVKSSGQEGNLLELLPPDGFVACIQLDQERWPIMTGTENLELVEA